MSLQTTLFTAVALAVAATTALYFAVVPSATATLGSLETIAESSDSRNESARKRIAKLYPKNSGAFTDGKATFYTISGPSAGRKLVLIHGISGTWATMPQVVSSLAANGFNVLTYDIYGRGYSAAPGIKYSGDDYARQLHDLMEHIGWKKASVMGYSLGGGVAATFADSHSDKVDDLLFVAPAGLMRDLPPAAKFLSTTILGSLISYTVGRRMISKRSRGNHNPIYINQPHMQLFCDVQDLNILLHPGFLRAYIATGLNGPVRNMDSVYARLGTKFGSRIFCLWGRHDTVCNFKEQALLFKSLVPQATFVEVDSGHSVFPETCEKVLEPAVEFLNRKL